METERQSEDPELLTVSEVGKLVRLSRVSIWRWTRSGRFPQPVNVGPRRYWIGTEVRDWLSARIAEREQVEAPTRAWLEGRAAGSPT